MACPKWCAKSLSQYSSIATIPPNSAPVDNPARVANTTAATSVIATLPTSADGEIHMSSPRILPGCIGFMRARRRSRGNGPMSPRGANAAPGSITPRRPERIPRLGQDFGRIAVRVHEALVDRGRGFPVPDRDQGPYRADEPAPGLVRFGRQGGGGQVHVDGFGVPSRAT